MQHAAARQTISLLLAGDGLGAQALLTMLAGGLRGRPAGGAAEGELAETLWARVAALPSESAPPWSGPANQAPVPGDGAELVAQLAPLAAHHLSDAGLSLGLLAGLAELWPHVASEERPLLRTRFLNSLMAGEAAVGSRGSLPREAQLTAAELRVWNRYMPTATGDSEVTELPRLLSAPTAQAAYHLLGGQLVGGLEFRVLARVLGSLALQVADQRGDPQGLLLHPLVGAVAAERLAGIAPAEVFSTLLIQLSHQLWWCANGAGLARRGDEHSAGGLADAIRHGQADAARRRARVTRLDEAGWWTLLTPPALDLAYDATRLRRVVICMWTLAARGATHELVPDDLAALAALLADGAAEAASQS